MDQRLVERIARARRDLRIARGAATDDDLRASSLGRRLEDFKDATNVVLSLQDTVLLGIEFALLEGEPVARLTADGVTFELRSDGKGFELYGTASQQPLLRISPDNDQSSNLILVAIGDYLDLIRQRPASERPF